jgi:hypothetical protein
VSLLEKSALIGCSVGMKLEIRLIFGEIIQFFVCGSEFRARWLRIHVEQGNSYQNLSKWRFSKIVG